MAHWKDAAVTNSGVEMLNEWMAGRKITIVAAYGGTGTVDPELLTEQTELVDMRQKLNLLGEEDSVDGKTVQVQVNNAEVMTEYELNQVGIYAALDVDRNPGTEERLLFIMQDEKGVAIPSAMEASFLLELYCMIGITNNGRFEVSVSTAGIVTAAYMREALERAIAAHNADPGAHNSLAARMLAIETALNGSGTILQAGDPTVETVGQKGQHYINTETGAEFECVEVNGDGYIWTPAEDGKSLRALLDETSKKLQEVEESGGTGSGNGSSNTIKITFDAAFAGAAYTVTDGEETRTGTVPEELVVSVKVSNCNSTYTIRATADNGVEYAASVMTGAYYGQYTAALSVFNAGIHVTTAPGAKITAAAGGSTFTAVADNNGAAIVWVNRAGTYTLTATKEDVSSSSTEIVVENEADTYTAEVRFIILEITSPVGSVITIQRKD